MPSCFMFGAYACPIMVWQNQPCLEAGSYAFPQERNLVELPFEVVLSLKAIYEWFVYNYDILKIQYYIQDLAC